MKKRYLFLMVIPLLLSGYFLFQNTQHTASANISYAKDIQPILQSRCASCHLGKAKSAGLSMNTYASLMTGSEDGPVIIPGNASQSFLVEKITAGEMPKRGPKLTPAQIQLITDWVNAGAANN